MAVSSGVCYSSKARDSRLKIEWEKTGTWSSTTCGTNIRWRLILENGNYWYNNAIRCYAIYINGNKVSDGGTWSNYTSSGNHTLIDWQNVSIEHNTNGSEKTFNINFSGWFYSSYDVSGSTDFTLPKIPRYTSITSFVVNKRDETSVTVNWNTADIIDKLWYSKDDGNNWVEQTITQGKSGNFNITSGLSAGTLYTFKIKVRRKDSQLETESLPFPQSTYSYPSITTIGTPDLMIGDAQTLILYNPLNRKNISIYMKNSNKTKTFYSGTLAEGTSITFTPNASTMYENIPDDPFGDCVYYCVWSNHTSEDKSGAYRIIGNENPSYVSYTYADTNSETLALTGNNQILIKGHSNVRATVTPESKALPCPNVYSRILRYNFVNGSKSTPANYSDNATVTMDITAIEDNHLTLYAIESRGLSNYLEYALDDTKFKNYTDVTISSVTAVRGSNGVGKEVTLTFSGTFWNDSFGSVTNDFDTLKYYYKLTTANIWTEGTTTLTATKSGDNYSGSFSIRGDLGAEGFDVANSYNIRLVVADKLSTRTYETTLGAGTPAIAVYKNKVAIGGKYNTSLGQKLQVHGTAAIDNIIAYFASGTGGTAGYVKVATINITGGYQNAPIEFTVSRRGDNTVTRLSVRFSNSSSATSTELQAFKATGSLNAAWIHLESTGSNNRLFALYIQKTEGYDQINIACLHKPNYDSGIEITWTNVHASSLPSSNLTQASWGGNTGYAVTAGSTTKVGTSNVGTTDRPIYLASGTPTQCNTPASGNYFRGIPFISSGGVMEVGRYIDFHPTNGSTLDYSKRIDCGTGTTGRVLTLPDETCTLLGSVASSTNYIKMSDGTLICYGNFAVAAMGANDGREIGVSLPVAYKDTSYRVILQTRGIGNYWTWVRDTIEWNEKGRFVCVFTNDGGGTSPNMAYDWITIGRWK